MRLGPPPRIMIRRRPVGFGGVSSSCFVGRIVVGRVGLELGGAGVDRLEGRHDAAALAQRRTSISGVPQMVASCRSEKPNCLAFRSSSVAARRRPLARRAVVLHLHDLVDCVEKPRIDLRSDSWISSTVMPAFIA